MAKQQKKTVYKKIRKMTRSGQGYSATKKQPTSKPVVQQQPKQTTVELSKAKGRPMLVWVAKKSLERLTAFPVAITYIYSSLLEEVLRGIQVSDFLDYSGGLIDP
jgi:hypothetical protein